MNSFRAQCISRNIPIISEATEIFLEKLLTKYQPKNCIEIWSAVGYSTTFIANIIKKRNGTLHSFEISYPCYLEAIHHCNTKNIDNIKIYPFDFLHKKVNNLLPDSSDFVFIDAQKNQYGNFMMKIHEFYWTSPCILLDDVIKYHTKLSSLYEYLSKKQINYEILQLDPDDGVMLIN